LASRFCAALQYKNGTDFIQMETKIRIATAKNQESFAQHR